MFHLLLLFLQSHAFAVLLLSDHPAMAEKINLWLVIGKGSRPAKARECRHSRSNTSWWQPVEGAGASYGQGCRRRRSLLSDHVRDTRRSLLAHPQCMSSRIRRPIGDR